MAKLTLSLFGSFQATIDGEPPLQIASDKARAMLAYLAVESNRPQRRDALAGLLWPDQPQGKARHNLRQALSVLRRALDDKEREAPFLLITSDTIQFNTQSDHWLDVAVFENLVGTCRAHRHHSLGACLPCLQRMEQMDGLYQGSFMDHFSLSDSDLFEEWIVLTRERFHQEMVKALFYLTSTYERRGEIGQALFYARRQLRLEPWHEEAHRQTMRLLSLNGQRSTALAQYKACRRMLAEELGVEPAPETTALYQKIEAQGDQDKWGPSPPAHNLPPEPTPFIGRSQALAELAERIANPDCRLVTLVGPGGIGKTRLAIQAARQQTGIFPHGIYFVPLAPVCSPALIVPTMADALRFSFHGRQDPSEQLLSFLREKSLLLVIDNMEHVLEGANFLALILQRAPQAMLLVTSRERLNLQEEWVYEVKGLRYPQDPSPRRPESYHAVTLFKQTAQRVQNDFALAGQDLGAVVRICQALEGMPLGIELAAASVPVRSCAEIAEAIQHNMDLLSTSLRNVPERHRSLRAALEHSWNLLTEEERTVFRQLSVFGGESTAEAAASVAGGSPTTLAALERKSLLQQGASGSYRMQEIVRQYAHEKLREHPAEEKKTHDLHCEYYAAFLHQRGEWLREQQQKKALAEIGEAIENVRAAWQWAVSNGNLAAIGLSITGLGLFYRIRSWNHEGEAAFRQAVERLDTDGADQQMLLGQALAWQAHFAYQLGLYDEAEEQLHQSLLILSQQGDPRLAFALYLQAHILCYARDNYDAAEQAFRESIAIYEQVNDPYGLAQALDGWGDTAVRQGNFAQAGERYEQSLVIHQKIGDLLGTSVALGSLGTVAARTGDYGTAARYFQESLVACREVGNQRAIASCLHNLSSLAYFRQDYAEAKRLRQETLRICHEIGYRWGIASALKSLGDVAWRMESYDEALCLLQESLAVLEEMGDPSGQAFTLNSLGSVTLKLGQIEQSKQYLRRALAIALDIKGYPIALSVLLGLAKVMAREGQQEAALELTAFVLHHPATEKQTKDQAEPLRAEFAAHFTTPTAEAIEARGRARDLDAFVAKILGGPR